MKSFRQKLSCIVLRLFGQLLDQRREVAELKQALAIYGDTIMSQLEDLRAAVTSLEEQTAKLTSAVSALPGRIPGEPDLAGVTAAIHAVGVSVGAATEAVNAVNPAPAA